MQTLQAPLVWKIIQTPLIRAFPQHTGTMNFKSERSGGGVGRGETVIKYFTINFGYKRTAIKLNNMNLADRKRSQSQIPPYL